MKIIGLGLRYPDGDNLLDPLDETDFAGRLQNSLAQNASRLRISHQQTKAYAGFREELESQPAINIADPKSAGWTFLVHRDDPNRQKIVEILRPLARHREMQNPEDCLVFDGHPDWSRWMTDNYLSISPNRPRYVLIVGGPGLIPFHFQSTMQVAALVGRVAFDKLDNLSSYVDKVIRLEKADSPTASANAIFFGPDYGRRRNNSYDATYFSRRYMVEPLANFAESNSVFHVTRILAADATKERLLEAARSLKPAILYTASHGIGATNQNLDVQQRINGAICCQRDGAEKKIADYLVTADDIPGDEPFLEGAVFFQFACYGYGTPAISDFANWSLGIPARNAETDFVAALPKKLLANPRGPTAFIGHLDTAWLHGFDDPNDPLIEGIWHPRLAPFRTAVDTLLKLQPPGLAMADLSMRYNEMNRELANILEDKETGRYSDTAESRSRLASDFITRCDAQNYLVFGDPAAKVRAAK